MSVPICVVDSFTAEPFRGNPAAVCFADAALMSNVAWMQSVAAEMNLSETAFVAPNGTGWQLRWFTPAVEVDLCGHATLAAAHALWESGRLGAEEPARFQTRTSGVLTCRRSGAGIGMDFPARPAVSVEPPADLVLGLGARPLWCGRSVDDFLCELPDENAVTGHRPNFDALARVKCRGVIITARASRPGFDFISRFYAPAAGILEDPVTGSAHCTLAPFWSERLGRDSLQGWQASARGGAVGTRVVGDRVELTGSAVTVWKGELL